MAKTRFPVRSFNRRQFLQLAAGAAGVVTLAACAAPPTAEQVPAAPAAGQGPQHGGVLRIAMPDGVIQLDPAHNMSFADINLGLLTYDCLTAYDRSQRDDPVIPRLAEAWELSEDGLIYTFHLRTGVTFQQGTPVTADDVVYTFERLLDPASGLSAGAVLTFVERVEAVDEQTLQFHLTTPNVTLPTMIADPAYSIVPTGQTSKALSQEIMGSGPFLLAEHLPGERTVLRRNDAYWHPEFPYLDEVQFLTMSEAAAQIAALTSGTVDMVAQVGLEQLPLLEAQDSIALMETQLLVHLFVMRVTEAPFDDNRVRQAFKHAIDRAGLQQAMLRGRGHVGNDQLIAPTTPFWADVPALAHDVEKAKALLAEAGYADGLAVTLTVADLTPGIVDTAVAIQEMVKAAGITITLEKVPVDTYLAEKYGQVPFFVDWAPADDDPDLPLSFLFVTDAPYNTSGWSNVRVDELVAAARGEREWEKRRQLYAEVQQIISQEGPVVMPYFAPSLRAAASAVQGETPAWLVHAESIWLQ